MIKAFSRLKDKYPDWKLVVAGEIVPSFKDELEELLSNLKDRVVLTTLKLHGIRNFCLPSRGECFSIALLEAMYFENAIISSDVGVAEYILDYGNAGLIFENENIDEFTTKLDRLMKDENLRKKLTRNARLRCEKLFNWEK